MMKRYAMEFVGTFFLTVAISFIGNPMTIGLVLMAIIYIGGHISGAHFNPAVSFACFVQNRLQVANMGMYIAAQSLGAAAALCFFSMISGNSFALDIEPGSPVMGQMMNEALWVLLFAWLYLTMNFGRHKDTAVPGIVLGFTLSAIAFSGGLFNPAVAIASMACSFVKEGSCGGMATVAVYIVGPMLGALAASLMFDYFKSEQSIH